RFRWWCKVGWLVAMMMWIGVVYVGGYRGMPTTVVAEAWPKRHRKWEEREERLGL
nr:hypothetical protein [Tanacetum cinerariifolium]